MTRFLLISCLFFLFISCKSFVLPGAIKMDSKSLECQNHYFSNPETDYIYKAHIEVYGNDLSGLFVIKKTSDSIHRVVLTTDFGNKLLDFELSENYFKVNYILDNLNKKIIISTLKKDFRLLLRKEFISSEVFENEYYIIYKSKDGNSYNYFYQTKNDSTFIKLINASKTKEKVVFTFTPKNATFANSILIEHYNIKLKIELNQISN